MREHRQYLVRVGLSSSGRSWWVEEVNSGEQGEVATVSWHSETCYRTVIETGTSDEQPQRKQMREEYGPLGGEYSPEDLEAYKTVRADHEEFKRKMAQLEAKQKASGKPPFDIGAWEKGRQWELGKKSLARTRLFDIK